MATRIQIRRDTAPQWRAVNPVLAAGEPGMETDTGRVKFGDGVAPWLRLPYASEDEGIPHHTDPIFERSIGAVTLTTIGDYGPFQALEAKVRREFEWFHWFVDLSAQAASTFTHLASAAADGKKLMVSLRTNRSTGVTYSQLIGGSYDAKLDEWFSYFAGLGTEVVIRLNWEANLQSDPTSPLYTGADRFTVANATEWIAAWRYVVNRARSQGYSQFRWFWCMNNQDTGTIPMEQFWPGSDANGRPYADIVGYDSYNGLDGTWKSAEDTLMGKAGAQGNAYDRVCALHPTAEVWVGEISSVDVGDAADTANVAGGHSKADWWRDLFAYTGLARLTTVVIYDRNRTRNFLVDSTPASLDGFRDGIAGRRPAGALPSFAFPAGSALFPVAPVQASASNALVTGALRAVPFYLPTTTTVGALGTEVTVVGDAGSKIRLGLYADTGYGQPGALIVDAGQVAGDAVSSAAQVSFTARTLAPGWYWLAGVVQAVTTTQPTVRSTGAWYPPGFLFSAGTGTPGVGVGIVGYVQTGVTGALPAQFSTSPGNSGVAPRIYLRTA